MQSLHNGAWWANATRDFNFKRPDALDSGACNRLLWAGVMGERPYPVHRARRADNDEDEASTRLHAAQDGSRESGNR